MTINDITEFAREAGMCVEVIDMFNYKPVHQFLASGEDLMNFVRIIIDAEREACARLCSEIAPTLDGSLIAEAIRARGE